MERNLNIKDINQLSIKVASPDKILSWSSGEVLKPETLNYRTQRPEKDGLFSERIFGPTKDYECYCGKYKKVRYKGITCERCNVEVTRSSVRRERMGHITLASPVTHIWFLKTIPSKLSLILDISVPKLEKVIYYAAYVVTNVNEENRKRSKSIIEEEARSLKSEGDIDAKELEESRKKSEEILKSLTIGMILSEEEYYFLSQRFGDVFEAGRGAEAIRSILERIDLKKLNKILEKEAESTRDLNRKKKVFRRLKVVDSLLKSGVRPEWMILTVVPVLPPELRPMVPLDGGRYATADTNDLYRRVINRNNRLKKLIDLKSPDVILTNEKRMLQEAVDALIDNNARTGNQALSSRRRPLKSLADELKGKQGRFRQNLLGKRVDYSGRSVIVVGPDLELDQCGLPKNLALEIFRPFVINKIIERGLAYNIKQANRFIEQGLPEVWEILEQVISKKRVLLNRAPTLHRLGIQAFRPILIEDLAIRIHPMVCTAFNADFDGDQMAVHLPLTEEAQHECRTLMNAAHNLLKPSNGDPIVSPTQDIVLGSYYLTQIKPGAKGEGKFFSSFSEASIAYNQNYIDLRAEITVPIKGKLTRTTHGRMIFNRILPKELEFVNELLDKNQLSKVAGKIVEKTGINEAHKHLDKIKDLGFHYATLSAVSMGMTDAKTPPGKGVVIKNAEKEVDKIESQFEEGLLTNSERREKVIDIWTDTREKMGIMSRETLQEDENNSIFFIIDSKARGSWAQSNQIVGMRGLVANPKNETIELPIKSSYKDGLKILEYFISTHGARKGSTDTALKTASAGYLTRRLVDVAQDVIIRAKDCRTKTGLEILREDGEEYDYKFSEQLYSRTSLKDIVINRKKVVKSGEVIDKKAAAIIEKSNLKSVEVRSPINCRVAYGICSICYGWDLTKEKIVKEGEAVGIIAAQSIGEPGTQLTMRTFHIGGIAGVDITHGLPRVEEIFESRSPKGKAVMNKVDGKVESITESGLVRIVKIIATDSKKSKKAATEYLVPKGVQTFVKEGDKVEKGQLICEGHLDLKEILAYKGIDYLKRYIINEIQKVYVPQGSNINNKHVEIIVKQMLSRVIIRESGDSEFMVDDLVDKSKFIETNAAIKKSGGKPAKASQRIMGITKVSLTTESFLSAASFQETSRVLVNAAIEGRTDKLRGLKENVIIGKLIPAGTGYKGGSKESLDKTDPVPQEDN